MTENKKETKAPDYSQTAEKLCNPVEVLGLLHKLHGEQHIKGELEAKLKENCPQLIEDIATLEEFISQLQSQIREAVEKHGSFQDIENRLYAVKYRRMIKSYHVGPFKVAFSEYIPSVITETINVKVLEGLVKGKLITEEDLKYNEVITETAQYSFYVR